MSGHDHDNGRRSLQWLPGLALSVGGVLLPMMACASKSPLRALEPDAGIEPCGALHAPEEAGLRLVINDDHGMTPSVTIVNQTGAPVTLCAVRPSLLSTDNGTYDLHALLVDGRLTVEPDLPRIIRITDIGRNADEPFRLASRGDTVPR